MAFRRVMKIMAPSVLVAGGSAAVILPHTIFLDNVKQATQSYKNGYPIPVSDHALGLFDQVKKDMLEAPGLRRYNITTQLLDNIEPYTVFGFDMFKIGWIRLLGYGACLGIPQYFESFGGTLRHKGVVVNQKPLDWDAPETGKLKEFMLVSDEAKKFALCREMLMMMQPENELNLVNNVANLILPLLLVSGLNRRLNLSSKPLLYKGMAYSMVALFACGFWITAKDQIMRFLENKVDREMLVMGPRYVRGGREYYQSVVVRNISLRGLLGKEGASLYTTTGNEQYFIRIRHVPFVDQVNFYNAAAAELDDQRELEQQITEEAPIISSAS